MLRIGLRVHARSAASHRSAGTCAYAAGAGLSRRARRRARPAVGSIGHCVDARAATVGLSGRARAHAGATHGSTRTTGAARAAIGVVRLCVYAVRATSGQSARACGIARRRIHRCVRRNRAVDRTCVSRRCVAPRERVCAERTRRQSAEDRARCHPRRETVQSAPPMLIIPPPTRGATATIGACSTRCRGESANHSALPTTTADPTPSATNVAVFSVSTP